MPIWRACVAADDDIGSRSSVRPTDQRPGAAGAARALARRMQRVGPASGVSRRRHRRRRRRPGSSVRRSCRTAPLRNADCCRSTRMSAQKRDRLRKQLHAQQVVVVRILSIDRLLEAWGGDRQHLVNRHHLERDGHPRLSGRAAWANPPDTQSHNAWTATRGSPHHCKTLGGVMAATTVTRANEESVPVTDSDIVITRDQPRGGRRVPRPRWGRSAAKRPRYSSGEASMPALLSGSWLPA